MAVSRVNLPSQTFGDPDTKYIGFPMNVILLCVSARGLKWDCLGGQASQRIDDLARRANGLVPGCLIAPLV